jgi:hypothetical protein
MTNPTYMIGDWVHSKKFNVPVQLTIIEFAEAHHHNEGAVDDGEWFRINVEPIKLTREWALELGGSELPHYTITNAVHFDLDRNRKLQLGCIDDPNQMIYLAEYDYKDPKKIEDLIPIHNYDHDGYISVHKFQHIYLSLAGVQLTRKQTQS